MRLNPFDALLYLAVRLKKGLDRRPADLADFDPDRVRSIVILSTTALGDALMSTPGIRAVRRRFPQAELTVHVHAANTDLFRHNPDVDRIVPFYGGYRKYLRTIFRLRRLKPDLALLFHGNDPQAAPSLYLAGAGLIVALPRRTKTYRFLLADPGAPGRAEPPRHSIDKRLMTASFVGCPADDRRMVLVPGEEHRAGVKAYLDQKGRAGRRLVGFQTMAKDVYKVWPAENFIELGRRLAQDLPEADVVLIGSKAEASACRRLAEAMGPTAFSTAGELSLGQMTALIEQMDLLVTNDTGPMHMAVALGVPTVSLFCPTNPEGVGPIQDRHLHRVIKKERPCSPCLTKKCPRPDCMALIGVDEVHRAVLESLC